MDKSDGHRNNWEVIKLLLEEIKVEQHSIDSRMNMYHSSQSFLFAAFAISSLGEHMHHQAIHWFCNYVVPLIGILFSLFTYIALLQGRIRLFNLRACLRDRLNQIGGAPAEDSADKFCLPSVDAQKRALLYYKWVPVICGIVWLFVGMHSVWYEFVNKEVHIQHSSSEGDGGAGHGSHAE